MIILVDTAEFESVRFAAVPTLPQKVFEKKFLLERQQSHKTLGLLEKFLKSAKVSQQGTDAICVVTGEGSFNGIRTGVAVCMAISYAWEIPLYAIERKNLPKNLRDLPTSKKKKVSGANAKLGYGAEPNVTPAKNKKP
jgi:tRNA A37 threonylcarbamoyladenosine modification protein TsaB